MTDFNEILDLTKDIVTTYKGKELILKDCFIYNGPVTMQLLPFGGVQTIYNHNLVIYTKNGFIGCRKVVYAGIEMDTKTFTKLFPSIVNEVFPN